MGMDYFITWQRLTVGRPVAVSVEARSSSHFHDSPCQQFSSKLCIRNGWVALRRLRPFIIQSMVELLKLLFHKLIKTSPGKKKEKKTQSTILVSHLPRLLLVSCIKLRNSNSHYYYLIKLHFTQHELAAF